MPPPLIGVAGVPYIGDLLQRQAAQHQRQVANAAAPRINGTYNVTAPSGAVYGYQVAIVPSAPAAARPAPLAYALGGARAMQYGQRPPAAVLGMLQATGGAGLPTRGASLFNPPNTGWMPQRRR
jgi:hypothetical protein